MYTPFDLSNQDFYCRWRDWKLAAYPQRSEDLVVEVDDPRALTAAEANEIRRRIRKANMALYVGRFGDPADRDIPRRLGECFGLRHLDINPLADDDGISSLRVVADQSGRGYIPYSNRRLLWHTDGYYNPPERRIHAFILHCACPAAEGGENSLLDHEIVYLLLREANPEYIRALMAPDAMTIPPNTDEEVQVRPARSGPVFSVDVHGNLHMRYTARTRSVLWKDDAVTQEAVRFLRGLLDGGSPYLFRRRLNAGEGLIANNVLHNRTAFTDDPARAPPRLIYRARYYDRIDGTNLDEVFTLSCRGRGDSP